MTFFGIVFPLIPLLPHDLFGKTGIHTFPICLDGAQKPVSLSTTIFVTEKNWAAQWPPSQGIRNHHRVRRSTLRASLRIVPFRRLGRIGRTH